MSGAGEMSVEAPPVRDASRRVPLLEIRVHLPPLLKPARVRRLVDPLVVMSEEAGESGAIAGIKLQRRVEVVECVRHFPREPRMRLQLTACREGLGRRRVLLDRHLEVGGGGVEAAARRVAGAADDESVDVRRVLLEHLRAVGARERRVPHFEAAPAAGEEQRDERSGGGAG